MEEDSTPVEDDFDLSPENNQDSEDDVIDTAADSSDDDSNADDNAPSDSDDDSADDSKTKADDANGDDKTPTFDKDLDKWAKDRGIEVKTDNERKLAQIARDNQRGFSKRSEAEAAAKKIADNITETAKEDVADDEDPMVARLNNLESQLISERQNRQVSDFVLAMAEAGTPVTVEQSDAMADYIAQTAKDDGRAGVDFLLKNIPRWHKLATMDMKADEKSDDSITDKVRQEERERLAKKQNAGGPTKSAKSAVPAKGKDELTKIWEDDSI